MNQDREFEKYLEGNSGLSDAYADLPEIKTPDHLDAAILAEAHRAVRARPTGQPRRSWMVPLSMAASLFVVVIIGFQLRYLLPGVTVSSTPKTVPAENPARERAMDVAAQEGASRREAAAPAAVAPTPGLPAQPPADKRPDMRLFETRTAPETGRPAPAPEKQQARTANEPSAAPAELPVAAPAPAVSARIGAASVSPETGTTSSKQEVAGAGMINPTAPAPVMKAKKSAAAPPLQEAPASPATAVSAGQEETGQRLRASNNIGNPPTPAADMASAPAEAAGEDPQPEAWLKRIAQLKQQGKLAQARKELAAFKKRNPGYRIPKSLEANL